MRVEGGFGVSDESTCVAPGATGPRVRCSRHRKGPYCRHRGLRVATFYVVAVIFYAAVEATADGIGASCFFHVCLAQQGLFLAGWGYMYILKYIYIVGGAD